jgi:hypothetical protein
VGKLDGELWDKKMCFVPSFSDNFVHPDDPEQPGPSTVIAGLLRPVFFYEAEFHKWLADVTGAKAGQSRRGRRPAYDPDVIQNFVWAAMEHNGEFKTGDPWARQADLERHIRERLAESDRLEGRDTANGGLSQSRLRELIVPPLERWRAMSPDRRTEWSKQHTGLLKAAARVGTRGR